MARNGTKWHEMARNGTKWRANWLKTIFGFLAPKEKKIGYVKHFLPNMKKIKVVQNCMEWRETLPKKIFGFQPPPPNMKKIKIVQIQSYQTL